MRVHLLLVSVACGLWIGAAAIAQAQGTHVDVNRNGVHVDAGRLGTMEGAANGQIVRLKDLVGLKVYNTSDESLGKIEDLVIDPMAGKILYAVLSFGGILGIGDKYFAVPWQKLSFVSRGTTKAGTEKESYCVLNVPKDTLKNAPGFAKDNWPNFADNSWRQTIEQFYGTSRSARGQRNPQR
jgi:sporulation protein YlmC with PRC-barrel domain